MILKSGRGSEILTMANKNPGKAGRSDPILWNPWRCESMGGLFLEENPRRIFNVLREDRERAVTESSNDVDESSVTEGSLKRYWRILKESLEDPEREIRRS